MITDRRAFIVLQLVCAIAIVAGTAAGALGATATWDRNTEPDVAGYKLSYGTAPGVHSVTLEVGDVITCQFFPAPGQRYYVVVQAYNTAGALSEKSAEGFVDVPFPNRAPTLVQPADQSSTLNSTVSLLLSASDPDGNMLTFSVNGLPPGLSLNIASGAITGIATAKGTYPVSVSVSDGALSVSRQFTWIVSDPASVPVVIDLSPLDTTLLLNSNNTSTDTSLTVQTSGKKVAAVVLMKFDLSQIPQNAVIQSAVLNLLLTAADQDAGDPNYSISLHQVINRNPDIARATGLTADGVMPWTSNRCCQGGYPMAQSDISSPQSITVIDRSPGFKMWDASSAMRTWLASAASNFGLLLNADIRKGNNRFRTFSSAQESPTSNRPFLRVTYTVPAAAGIATAMSFAAATTDADTQASKIAATSQSVIGSPDVGVTGDFDGDGRTDLATFNTSAGQWSIWTSGSNFAEPAIADFGTAGDLPMPADYDGDRITDLAFYRPSTGAWHLWLSSTRIQRSVQWGGPDDQPITVDHDGDGKADLALVRNGRYEILLSSTNYSTGVTVR